MEMEQTALHLIHKVTTTTWVISPPLLEYIYHYQVYIPFYIVLSTAMILLVILLLATCLPGGSLAGKVSLMNNLENDTKLGLLQHDNEYETEYLGSQSISGNSKTDKRGPQQALRRMSMDARYSINENTIYSGSPPNLPISQNFPPGDDDMEI